MIKKLLQTLAVCFLFYIYDCSPAARRYSKPLNKKKSVSSFEESLPEDFSINILIKMHQSCLKYADEMHAKRLGYVSTGSSKYFVEVCDKAEKKARATAELYKQAIQDSQEGKDPWHALKNAFGWTVQDAETPPLQEKKKTIKSHLKKAVSDFDSHSQRESDDFSSATCNSGVQESGVVRDSSWDAMSDLYFPSQDDDVLDVADLCGSHLEDDPYQRGFFHASFGLEMLDDDPDYVEGFLSYHN